MDNTTIDYLWQTYLWLTLVILIVGIIFYFLPTFVAFSRGHQSRWAILFINALLGVTILGWIGCLLWALSEIQRSQIIENRSEFNLIMHDGRRVQIAGEAMQMGTIGDHNQKTTIDQLDQLAKLRSNGALSEDEFARLKASVISERSPASISFDGSHRQFSNQRSVADITDQPRLSNRYALALATLPIWGSATAVLAVGVFAAFAHYIPDASLIGFGFIAFFLGTNIFLGLRDLALLDDEGVDTIPTGLFALFTLFYPLLAIYFWRRGTVIRAKYGNAIAFPRKHLLIWLISFGIYLTAAGAISTANPLLLSNYKQNVAADLSGNQPSDHQSAQTDDSFDFGLALKAVKQGTQAAVAGNIENAYMWLTIAITHGGATENVLKMLEDVRDRISTQERARAEDLLAACKSSNYTKCGDKEDIFYFLTTAKIVVDKDENIYLNGTDQPIDLNDDEGVQALKSVLTARAPNTVRLAKGARVESLDGVVAVMRSLSVQSFVWVAPDYDSANAARYTEEETLPSDLLRIPVQIDSTTLAGTATQSGAIEPLVRIDFDGTLTLNGDAIDSNSLREYLRESHPTTVYVKTNTLAKAEVLSSIFSTIKQAGVSSIIYQGTSPDTADSQYGTALPTKTN